VEIESIVAFALLINADGERGKAKLWRMRYGLMAG
jgi:hypothetical protein